VCSSHFCSANTVTCRDFSRVNDDPKYGVPALAGKVLSLQVALSFVRIPCQVAFYRPKPGLHTPGEPTPLFRSFDYALSLQDIRARIIAGRLLRLAAGLFSCGAACISAPGQTNVAQVRIELPLQLRRGDLLVETRVNGSGPLTFKLDTGFGITAISPKLADSLRLEHSGRLSIRGIAGVERADTFKGAEFSFAGMSFRPGRVAALDPEHQSKRRTPDGILGADFFWRFVVEIDVARRRMRLGPPEEFSYQGRGEVIPLQFRRDTPIVEAVIVAAGREPVTGRFEIDTGCDDCLCLGQEFVAANRLLEGTKASAEGERHGVGGSTPIRRVTLDELRLGKLTVKKPAANCFLHGSPTGGGLAGHIGLGALQRYKMTFRYGAHELILEPNS